MIQANAPEKSSKSIQVDPRAFDVDKSGHLSTEERGRFPRVLWSFSTAEIHGFRMMK
jgi:hypothetical protein